jgi:hypothetical protein
MWVVTILVLLAGGLLGAANLIVARKPDAQAMIEKLRPFHTHPVYFLRSIQRVLQSDRIRSGVRAFQAAEASASRLS